MCAFFVLRRKHLIAFGALLVFVVFMCSLSVAVCVQSDALQPSAVRVPILMYHSILKDPAAAGDYVISPEVLEADLRYLKNNGYTTVLSRDLYAYVTEGKRLPEKPVVITFDDGHANNLLYALPILEKLDMCAVISIVGKYSEQYSASDDHHPSYAYLSWSEINALLESGRIEIANHSYDMHEQLTRKGTMKKADETQETYTQRLKLDLNETQRLLNENCHTTPIAFTYPFGAVCYDSIETVKEIGFCVTYGCAEQVNYISDAASLYCLGRFNRPSGIATEKFMQRIEK